MAKLRGDRIELGDIVGHPWEPGERYARVVGLRNDDCRAMERVIIRRYADDTEPWPSGDYLTTWLVVPWMPEADRG